MEEDAGWEDWDDLQRSSQFHHFWDPEAGRAAHCTRRNGYDSRFLQVNTRPI